jgi:hypothetical protein
MVNASVRSLILLLVLSMLLPVSTVMAQSKKIRLKPNSGKVKVENVRTPDFKDSKKGSNGNGGYWTAIEVEFELDGKKDEWLDSLEIFYRVLIHRKDNDKFILAERSIDYNDIQGGKKLFAVAYLKPNFTRRYFNSKTADPGAISVYIEIRSDGVPIQKKTELITVTGNGVPKDWFSGKRLENVRVVSDVIFRKSETPFAALDYDYYLDEKPAR